MSGNRGPAASSFGPTSGLSPRKLMWSASSTRSPASPLLALQRAHFGDLPLQQRAEAGEVRLVLALGLAEPRARFRFRHARLLQPAFRLGLRLANDDLGLALGGGARVGTQLLRRHQRFVHRLLALAKRAQLVGERREPLFEHRALADHALQRVGHPHPEILDPERLVAAQALAELLLADVEGRQVEAVFVLGIDHVVLAPNSTVPKRITVAPSSTAIP